MRGIVAWFDPATEERVLSLWAALDDLGIAAQQPPSRPHVSLVVAGDVDPAVAVPVLAGLVPDLAVSLGAVALFPPAILHLPVTPSRELLALQAEVARAVGTGVRDLDVFYAVPGRWQPHCTLATDVTPALLADAVGVVRAVLPLEGRLVAMGVEEAGTHRRWVI